jgi:hypothetical protein
MIAGLFNSTLGTNALTLPVTGGPMSILPISTVSGTIQNTSVSSSSTSIQEKPFPLSIVTVTDKTTVTETSCSDSLTPINSLKTASTSPTSAFEDDVVDSTVPAITYAPKTTLVHTSKLSGTTALSPALQNDQTSQPTVVMITKTAWTTTWTSVTAQPGVPFSSTAKESHSSAHRDSQQPIDQAYAKPIPSPVTTPMMPQTPVLANSTNSCTSNGTSSPAVSKPSPTVHTALPIFGTAGTKSIKTFQSPHPTPKIPIIPNLPFGHPPLFSKGTVVWNQTTLSFYHEKPTIHPGAASISKAHVTTAKASSTSHPERKCTTTFVHSPTQPCTITSYAYTKTIAVDCYGCVGEQAQATGQVDHEAKVRVLSTTK